MPLALVGPSRAGDPDVASALVAPMGLVVASGRAASFDGSNQFLSRGDNAALSFGAGVACTICLWVNLAAKAGDMGLIAKWTAGSAEYQIKYNVTLDCYVFSVTGTTGTVDSAFTPLASAGSVGTWHFLAAQMRVGTDVRIAMDGGAWNVQAHTSDIRDDTSAFALGRNNEATPKYLAGLLDEVGIWKAQLSDANITAVYNADLGLAYADLAGLGLTTGLVDWWDLDEASGATPWIGAHGGNDLTNNNAVQSGAGKR